MDPDLILTIGVVLGVLTIPSLLSAWTDGRTPRFGAIMALTSGALIAFAASNKASGYAIADVPHVMLSTIARILN